MTTLTKQYIQKHIKEKNIDTTKPFVLSLCNRGIINIESGVFDNLINLEVLNLHNNQLSSLPADVFDKLVNLTRLDLSNNQIKGIDDDSKYYSNKTKILELIQNLKSLNNEVQNVDNTIDGNTTLNDIKNNINEYKENIIKDIINFLQK
jgi:hypothetical protein